MDIVKVFGSNLKKYRTAMGISQEAFADKCGMHRTYISAVECYRRSISLENIQRRWPYRLQKSHRSGLSKGAHTALFYPSNPQQHTLRKL